MTDWGRQIRVDGVRPAWLTDDDRLCWWSSDTYGGMTTTAGKLNWQTTDGCAGNPGVKTIRLPADSYVYRALDAGFEPWPGGDNAPDDWEYATPVLLSDGMEVLCTSRGSAGWRRGDSFADIIGYRRKSEPTLRTSDEALRRMEALVRRMAALEIRPPQAHLGLPTGESTLLFAPIDHYFDAREIVKLLPEPPVDPDEQEAFEIVAPFVMGGSKADWVDSSHYKIALAALRRGRELAADR